ncbi:MAG: DUF3459 domain-containing protein [Burkholderiales bacterium]|nr:DUF3459 domain-containing protein [Burkholderiales bacterium]MDE1926617.1 DUF3459 domain-containing protein [Burkholderiales bacterium]MDE2157789.1 DUF3459 domain-containing protein [Burkholderiales bacterium]MDE2505252.1 DUF3459 domain-containing protein [Burkholderiales bacterium]
MRRRDACAALAAPLLGGCSVPGPAPAASRAEFVHVPWSRHASLYEINVRQFSAAGDFAGVETQLPRLAALGVGILWFMPIQPIGISHRKGRLGSYYSIRDYLAVNPDFGSLADFKRVVRRAHELGMHVILDWVANHTAWDHPWVTQHPDWYLKDARGGISGYVFHPDNGGPVEHWSDVVGLDYRRSELWPAMIGAMQWWLDEAGIDGFRCDAAHLVPTPFWEQARRRLERRRPLFMLAEADQPELHAHAFDMSYDWDLQRRLVDIAQGRADAATLRAWWARTRTLYPPDAYRMNFTTNHDQNSWNGSDAELYRSLPAFKAMAVLAALLPGMALVYDGQEAFLDRRLAFFDRDPIAWKRYELAGFYTRLLQLRRHHPALGNGQYGGGLDIAETDNDAVFAFTRTRGPRSVAVAVNLSPQPQGYAAAGGTRRALAPWASTIDAI